MENNLPIGVWENLDSTYTYNHQNFNLDVLKFAISEYMQGRPIPTFEEELQSRLDRARKSIKYNETWYTPSFEDLKESDTISIMSSWGWVEGKFPSILWQETHVNMAAHRAGKDDDVRFRFNNVTIRKRKEEN